MKSGLAKIGASIKFRHPLIDKNAKNVPGPGVYEYKSGLSKQCYTMGGRSKTPRDIVDNNLPGPGNYEPTNPN